jgi:cyclic pyranopterin phosphate synthase
MALAAIIGAMTTASCQPPVRHSLTVLPSAAEAHPNPHGPISGPRDISAVKMLRISVTDVCNLRCVYCMPEEGVEWLPKSHLLSYEELATVVRAAARLGVTHFKLTGGEPTARRDLPELVRMLAPIPGVKDLSLTTNGVLLSPMLEGLHAAGLRRVTVSLDSLRPERFAEITRSSEAAFHKVWASIERAIMLGMKVKLNVVAMRGVNEREVADFAGLTRRMPVTVRFIEFMPLGRSGLTEHPEAAMINEEEIRAAIEAAHGRMLPVRRESEPGVGPAKVWMLEGAQGRVGFISAMSHPFCETCNRLRLTPDGLLRSCLFDGGEVDLKPLLRATGEMAADGSLIDPGDALADAFRSCTTMKPVTHSQHGNKAMNRIGG